MKFLRSKHVLVLAGLLLAIEVLVRLGAYEFVVQPFSHSGTTITMKNALDRFGKDAVDVLTFGDSRADQGLDNRLIFEAARERDLNHLRASMPGSHFLTFKVMARWSEEEFPNLQGVVLAISPEIFGRLGNGAYETAKVLPLRNYTSVNEIMHHIPFNRADIRTFAPFYSASGYREDFKDLLRDPAHRRDLVKKRNASDPLRFLTFSSWDERDICAIPTADPAACLAELRRVGDELPEMTSRALRTLCKAAASKPRTAEPGSAEKALTDEWVRFLSELAARVRVLIILLPDHSVFQEHIYQPNVDYVVEKVIGALEPNGNVDVLDMRDLIQRQKGKECSYYRDHRHLNMFGKEVLTDAALPALEAFWAKLPGARK